MCSSFGISQTICGGGKKFFTFALAGVNSMCRSTYQNYVNSSKCIPRIKKAGWAAYNNNNNTFLVHSQRIVTWDVYTQFYQDQYISTRSKNEIDYFVSWGHWIWTWDASHSQVWWVRLGISDRLVVFSACLCFCFHFHAALYVNMEIIFSFPQKIKRIMFVFRGRSIHASSCTLLHIKIAKIIPVLHF